MKLVIDIPEKEFGVEIADHFQCFFERIRAEIKERLISNDTLVCGNYELETAEMFLIAFKNATIVQEPKTDIRECGSCKHSKDGHIADTEECHMCMWESKQEPKTDVLKADKGRNKSI